MAPVGISVVRLRRLRAELRRARESAGLTQKQVAIDLGWSLSKVIRIETGAASISTSDVMALLHYYQITDVERSNELLAITRTKERSWWWDEHREVYEPQFLHFLAYEDSATRIRQFQWLAVPGLLQTESYARALIRVPEDPEATERAVRVRLRRQQLLHRANGTEMTFVLDESVIRRQIGGSDVMTEQLRHLKDVNRLPNANIHIVPFSTGASVGMGGSFTILDLTSEIEHNLDYVVTVEEPKSDILIRDNPETASHYVESFCEIYESALSKAETNDLLDMILSNAGPSVRDHQCDGPTSPRSAGCSPDS